MLRLERHALALSAALYALLAHPICNLVFSCGCGVLALTAHCNVHRPAPPRCPFCAAPTWFALAAAVGLACAVVALGRLRRRDLAGTVTSVAAALGGFVLGTVMVGLLAALATGYPTFLGIRL